MTVIASALQETASTETSVVSKCSLTSHYTHNRSNGVKSVDCRDS